MRAALLSSMLTLFFLLQPALSQQTVRLATGNDYKPFTDKSLPQGGMITAIVSHIFKKMGYIPEIEYLSWDRGYVLSEQAAFQGTFPYVKTPERLDDFYFSDPIFTIVTRFFVLADSDVVFQSDSDLQGLTACKPLGYHLSDIQTLLDWGIIDLQRPNTMESCFRMLKLGRVDLVPINEHVGWEVVKQIQGEKGLFRVLERSLQETGLHFIISKQHHDALDLLNRFNTILEQMLEDGSLDHIVNQYLSRD